MLVAELPELRVEPSSSAEARKEHIYGLDSKRHPQGGDTKLTVNAAFQAAMPDLHAALQRSDDPQVTWPSYAAARADLLPQSQAARGSQALLLWPAAAAICESRGNVLHAHISRLLQLYLDLSKMEGSSPREVAELMHTSGVWATAVGGRAAEIAGVVHRALQELSKVRAGARQGGC
jgi:hypothetical protein